MQPTSKILRIVLIIIIGLVSGCKPNTDQSHSDSMVVEATGENFNWYFRYPGLDGILGNEDDQHSIQNLFLPANTAVTINLKSKDYIYSFALPDLSLKEVAVPDIDINLRFDTGTEKNLKLLGDQFCGFAHKTLIGEIRILNQADGFYQLNDISLHLTQERPTAKQIP